MGAVTTWIAAFMNAAENNVTFYVRRTLKPNVGRTESSFYPVTLCFIPIELKQACFCRGVRVSITSKYFFLCGKCKVVITGYSLRGIATIGSDALELLEGTGAEAASIIAITKVAALAYLMFNLYTPPCFAAIGAMNSEMKSAKWVWGGIGLQLGVGYTVGYLVYTVGTLVTAPETLAVAPALSGLAAVIVFAVVIGLLIARARKKIGEEYTLGASAGKSNVRSAGVGV